MLRELNKNEMNMVSGGHFYADVDVDTGGWVHPSTTGGNINDWIAIAFSPGSESHFSLGSGDISGTCCDFVVSMSEDGLSAKVSMSGTIDAFSFNISGEDIKDVAKQAGRWAYENFLQPIAQGEEGPLPGDSNYD